MNRHTGDAIGSPMLLAKARSRVDAAAAVIATALALSEGGRRIDLTGLDDVVGIACAATLDLDPHDGRALKPSLVKLVAELDALASALATAHAGS